MSFLESLYLWLLWFRYDREVQRENRRRGQKP